MSGHGARPPRSAAAWLAGSGLPLAEARLLLARAMGTTREALIASPATPVEPDAAARFAGWVARRRRGEPIAYLVGEREFYGHGFAVTPAVLVPRPETELLVDIALQALREMPNGAPRRVLDLGTGSGCVAISIALAAPAGVEVVAVDRSPEALAVAAGNAERLGARVSFVESDWFAGLPAEHPFDLIVANPPYIAAGDPHLLALTHEPELALVAGPRGLDALRTIVAEAPRYLVAGGRLAVEHGYDQGGAVRELFARARFVRISTHRDGAGHERVCTGVR